MYSQSDIQDAVAGGALSAEQAAGLRNFVAARNGTPTGDEEHVRILLGFNDLYVFYASIFLLIGLGWVGSKIDVGPGPSPFMALFVAAAAWGLAEVFARRHRLALPAIAFATCFVYGVFFSAYLLVRTLMGPEPLGSDTGNLVNAGSALLGAGGAFLYWKRFREPITISLGVGMVAMAIMFLAGAVVTGDPDGTIMNIVLLVLGLLVFVYAMMWDGKDRRRETASADVGFWLHWTAAWMVIIAIAALLDLNDAIVPVATSIVTIVLFILFTLVALAVGRRIWVLAAAYPLGVGIFHLIKGQPEADLVGEGPYAGGYGEYGATYGGPPPGGGYGGGYGGGSMSDTLMQTFLIVGVILVLIGMFWSPIRRMVAGILPPGLRARVPATGPQAASEAQTFD